ncbi:Cytochrome P450 monooxygenase ACRTS1 [Colletotrichum sp. SAR 10_77]|nr:Cytochrome P450 monooxygenase ACRTS1 [Colletotrichum sp. SAR 10_77]
MLKFRKNLDEYSRTHQIFDLKELIAFFVLDVLGDLAFRYQFDSQIEKNTLKLPPINDHIFLACLMGMMPNFMPFVKAVSPWIPIPWVQRLLAARQNLKNLTIECVRSRMADPGAARKDLITSLINARDPETGSELTELDIQTEAFAFM